ncbi:uncharacterized protein PGTG_11080 [Puccinia graminis f. sp. tritici CRL 75-36-700-3]|uniref:Uncharacterized protein n=1 Tax=Puccinia graminis f. sp. tritici (strain CRL 75-36-700-3 / race SCCL) TaxID=418459 RepID=E3KNB5_PUCGT|nr:uncharacterized protein PGTG_11080 [Puccinia graminis f. sp. tritici CRL 75-36-700-3]EFP85751.2 hypothetical protein PGTG_11080 [Puccinia graminis f. sp. tritici CRL 75-36-700-3]
MMMVCPTEEDPPPVQPSADRGPSTASDDRHEVMVCISSERVHGWNGPGSNHPPSRRCRWIVVGGVGMTPRVKKIMNPSRGQRLEYESKPIFKCELKSGYQIEAQIGFDSARWSRPQAENFMIRVHGTNTKSEQDSVE